MSLDVGMRHEVRGVLTCLTAVHVGGWEPSPGADLAVARDGLDRPVIPGTSLAGALRAWLGQLGDGAGGRRFDDGAVKALFGHVVPRTQDGVVSRIRVDDAQLVGDLVAPVVRDGVAIHRRTGAAAAGFLFEREVLPAGTRFGFRLVADEPRRGDSRVAEAVAALVAGLRAGRVPIGAARTRGLGRVVLDAPRTRSVNLSRPDGLTQWLTGQVPWVDASDAPSGEDRAGGQKGDDVENAAEPAGDGKLSIEIHWHPVGPVMVKDSIEGALVDTLPLTEVDVDGAVRLLLPGSSVKGVFRAHAERIVRTLLGTDAFPSMRQTLAEERLDGVDALFGAAAERRTARRSGHDTRSADDAHSGQGAPPGSGGRRGALIILDCHSTGHVPVERWQAVVTAHPSPDRQGSREERSKARDEGRKTLRERLDTLNEAFALRITDHVAVDRWTGGAADNLLFSVLEPAAANWEPIRLRLDIRHLRRAGVRHSDELVIALLLLVLRDLADGWLALGFGGTRGRGHVAIDEVRFSGRGLPSPWAVLQETTLRAVLASRPPQVEEAMAQWAATFAPKGKTTAADSTQAATTGVAS
jgi:CRISPR/Cas system CSM-associated protein Csm3 (group 7 of RAMP superfamily)